MLKDLRMNPFFLTDVYNQSHPFLKENMDWELSHGYIRKNGSIWFGFNETTLEVLRIRLQHWMVDQLVVAVNEMGLPCYEQLYRSVVDDCGGWWPLHIQSLEEGLWVPAGTPAFQVRNTEQGYGDLVTYLEPIFMHPSFATGCATEAFHIYQYLMSKNLPLIKAHSFGFRGGRSLEDAYFASSGWGLYLPGTDDLHIKMHYPKLGVGSIMASAHKVVQQFNSEWDAVTHLVRATKAAGKQYVSMPIDTWDSDNFIENLLVPAVQYAAENDVHFVARPDSGPVWEQGRRIFEKLRVENNYTNGNVIIGEGMNRKKMIGYDVAYADLGYDLPFFVYGIGGGFYNHITRDDPSGMAMKTAFSNGKDRMKYVKSDPFKRSLPGEVFVGRDEKGQMVVGSTVVNGKINKEELHLYGNLYKDVYYYEKGMDAPAMAEVSPETYYATAERAKQQTGEQERIIVLPSLQHKIATFAEMIA